MLCTLACSLPGEPADATATTGESTGDASSSTEESSITDSILTSTSPEDTADDTTDEETVPLAAPYLYVDYSPIKRYEFSWKPIAGADYYQLLERPYPEEAGWSQLGGDLVGTSTTWSMPIHLRLSAAYKLRACNQAGCKESDPVQVDPGVDHALGYFKASNAENNDNFGRQLALSADGTTMVVTALGRTAVPAASMATSSTFRPEQRCGLRLRARGRHVEAAGVFEVVQRGRRGLVRRCRHLRERRHHRRRRALRGQRGDGRRR
ncbi:hypothetical protein [Nannocystis pusilla]|uniref:hypothetical protein n=1 Tax=Nannocystis pusilla TaxID=889268 RepID=UPI003B7FB65B